MATPLQSNGPGGTKSHQLFLLLKDAINSGHMGTRIEDPR